MIPQYIFVITGYNSRNMFLILGSVRQKSQEMQWGHSGYQGDKATGLGEVLLPWHPVLQEEGTQTSILQLHLQSSLQ